VLFADVQALKAGTSGTRIGEAPSGFSCVAIAELAKNNIARSESATERPIVLFMHSSLLLPSLINKDQPVGKREECV
jgi:hypothetical protein